MLHLFKRIIKNSNVRAHLTMALATGTLFGGLEAAKETFVNSSQNATIAAATTGFASGAILGFSGRYILGKTGCWGKLPGPNLSLEEKMVWTGATLTHLGIQSTKTVSTTRQKITGKLNLLNP